MGVTRKRNKITKNKTRRSAQLIKTIWFPVSIKTCSDSKIPRFILDGYYGFTLPYFVYFSYNQGFISFNEFKSFLDKCTSTTKLSNNINLLELIYLTLFNKKVHTSMPSYALVEFLQKRIKANDDFILYRNFYRNYFTYKLPKYERLSMNAQIIRRINDLLGAGLYTHEMYNNLSDKDKDLLLNAFYTVYIDNNNLIDIHPIIFNFNMYIGFAKKIIQNRANGIRIIIGESLNKLGLLMDVYNKSDSYYIPYSKSIYKNNTFTVDPKYKEYLTEEYLDSYRSIINAFIPYSVMKSSDIIHIYDIVSSGSGMLSFVHIFNILFPEFKHKLHLNIVTTIINKKYELYYQKENLVAIKNKLLHDNFKYTIYNFKCNMYILSVFTEEIYDNRCFISLPIEKIKDKDMNVFQEYIHEINRNNLIKFFIRHRSSMIP
jgi:hypothetical protein